MVHLDRIYTRSGDDGTTSIGNGQRVSKLHPRIVAAGALDELNSVIGVACSAVGETHLRKRLLAVQQLLFDAGADLCVPWSSDEAEGTVLRLESCVIAELEEWIDSLTAGLSPLRSFVLPGGNPSAASLHFARSICRRAELAVLSVQECEPGSVNTTLLIVLNRLSDLLFVLARCANDNGQSDILWEPRRNNRMV
ncbi:MAG: cob(I)yrinic acid a,c-diamide adenosyltransferase [Planctomycetaceae bacterium]|nr:cob(I)yrinic acid a,c-diamide adenosyltransferase [Planctomycetaceae bacterium]